jgi:hypothetical protein
MAEVFAGFIVGFALSIAVAPLGAILLVRSNDRTGIAQRVAPPGTNVVALSVVLHFAAMLVLTMIGMLLGLLLLALDDRRPDNGLASPNAAYTLIVVALAAVIVMPTLVVRSIRRRSTVAALVSVLAFGWGVPWLAWWGS